ncbi:hypothetical protein NX059_003468 [Plenodomus lindquistii]|nr:hypothetical protein NX059_003468 [Plenodomus lindquistii]
MAAATQPTEVGLKERFFRQFSEDVKVVECQIESLKDKSVAGTERDRVVDDCLASIDRLSRDVKDASSYIPAYDQRTYSQAVKALSDSLQAVRSTFNPPKRFAFKARKAAASKSSDAPPSDQSESSNRCKDASSIPSSTDKQTVISTDTADPYVSASPARGTEIHRPSFSGSTQVTLSQLSGLHIVLPPSASRATSAGTLSYLTDCVVDLTAATSANTPFDTLYLKNIKNSLIVCGRVAGAIHITDMQNSLLVTACHQFRMHASRDVDIYLHASSRPIFEGCTGLRFAPLPDIYVTDAISQVPNQWNQIDDFEWLKSGLSPNFSILEVDKRVDNDLWYQAMVAREFNLDKLLSIVRAAL